MRDSVTPFDVLLSRRAFLKRAALALPALALASSSKAWASAVQPVIQPDLSIDFLASYLPLMHRNDWAPLDTVASLLRRSSVYTRITVHHDGNAATFARGEEPVMRKIQGILDAHIKRHYGDIGYHFVVDYSGRVWEGRPLRYQGAHVSNQNVGNIGIVLLGNFEEQHPSSEQAMNLEVLIRQLCQRFRIEPGQVYGHRDLAHSICPGRHLYTHLAGIRTALEQPIAS